MKIFKPLARRLYAFALYAALSCLMQAECRAGGGFSGPRGATAKELPEEFCQWLQSPVMRSASVGMQIAVLRPGGGVEVLYSHDASRALTPASVLKLVTTATALQICGGDACVDTEVGLSGMIDASGVLDGDLIVRGHGNALLGSAYSREPWGAFTDSVVSALRHRGVRKIAGRVIADECLLPGSSVPVDWTWEDLGNYYAAGIYGLNVYDNTYTLTLDTSHPGSRPEVVKTSPAIPGLSFCNRLLAVSYAHDSAYIYGVPGDDRRTLYGAVPHRSPTFTLKGDIPNPPLLAARLITEALRRDGIEVALPEEVRENEADVAHFRSDNSISVSSSIAASSGDVTFIYTHHSEPLRYVASVTNVYSHNLLAEMLLRQISLCRGDGSLGTGTRALLAYWQKRGVETSGVQMYDGCGLAPADKITAEFLTQVLARSAEDADFTASLAVAGRTGTVRNFLKGTRLEGRAFLKTGTTKQVIAYAGYVDGNDGRRYVCSFIVNNFDGSPTAVRKKIEKWMLLLIP